ncbi:hypothetical protein C8F04DRAFT_1280965 [Mycena alexandri]|uniref:Uncharacterized protein n=1 Tax=Mycena alexandri TaxID=1745969 RepID=A0AAD6WLB2_9AGAR|nr:hypothetical protein C8F04DRAFT_1280965 [Mycena alexandri]
MSVLEAAARSPDSIAYYYCRVKTEMPGLELPPAYTTAVYAPDGLLHCDNGPTPFIGRIKATSVPPPHTVASLKRALVQAEKAPGSKRGPHRSIQDQGYSKADGLGATPRTPVALVFLRDPEEALCVSDTDEAPWNDELPIVYYRLYNRGETRIAPPRNALCVKRRIAKLEGKPIYKLADLFINTTTDDPRSSTDVVDDTQGSSRDKPLLVVLPERRPGLYGTNTARWLSPSPGDTLLTDGVAHCLVNLSMPDVEQPRAMTITEVPARFPVHETSQLWPQPHTDPSLALRLLRRPLQPSTQRTQITPALHINIPLTRMCFLAAPAPTIANSTMTVQAEAGSCFYVDTNAVGIYRITVHFSPLVSAA